MDFTNIPLYKTPFPALSAATNKDGFGYVTLKDRLPVILTKTIDTFARYLHDHGLSENDTKIGKVIIENLVQVRHELQHDKPLILLKGDIFPGSGELEDWNTRIGQWEDEAKNTWFQAPWLFAECYMYRRIADVVFCASENSDQVTPFNWFRDFDYFGEQKLNSFKESMEVCLEAAERLETLVGVSDTPGKQQQFESLVMSALWGNQVDLSMHAGKTGDEFKANVHKNHTEATKTHLLINDVEEVWRQLSQAEPGVIHYVLDNSGAELFMDLCLSDWLIAKGVAKQVIFHGKEFPWFISDVTTRDFDALLQYAPNTKDEHILKPLLSRWSSHVTKGCWKMTTHPFFTTYHTYSELSQVCPSLYNYLCQDQSTLWIFKGDLNYRKLVQDCQWEYPYCESFSKALGNLSSASDKRRPPLLALRTCKADVIAGLKKGQAEELDSKFGVNKHDKGWLVAGSFAVAQSD